MVKRVENRVSRTKTQAKITNVYQTQKKTYRATCRAPSPLERAGGEEKERFSLV